MLAIYSNSKTFGGVEMIILRFSEYLDRNDIEYVVVEDGDTILARKLTKIITTDMFNNISNEITTIFFPNVCKLLDQKLNVDLFSHVKLTSWVVHPNEAFTSFFPFSARVSHVIGYRSFYLYKWSMPSTYYSVQKLYNTLIKMDALYVMDAACKRSLKYFYSDIDLKKIKLLPIPVPVENLNYEKSIKIPLNTISIGYLGRMDIMKFSAVKPFLIDCVSCCIPKVVELHFIGTGSHVEKLELLCDELGVKFVNYGYQDNEKAREILYRSVTFSVAMGTSALDLASVGIPCILIDPSLSYTASLKKQSLYKYIHEVDEYTLGEYRDFPLYEKGKRSLNECINLIDSDFKIKSVEYVREHHNPDFIFDKIMTNIMVNELVLGDIVNLIKIQHKNILIRFRLYISNLFKR